MELSVTTSRQDDVSVVTVAGEVDVYTAAQLRAVLDEEIGAGRSPGSSSTSTTSRSSTRPASGSWSDA